MAWDLAMSKLLLYFTNEIKYTHFSKNMIGRQGHDDETLSYSSYDTLLFCDLPKKLELYLIIWRKNCMNL